MREIIIKKFNDNVLNHINSISKIAVVGGSPEEPELLVFNGRLVEVKVIGIEETSDIVTDLNFPISSKDNTELNSFDLVLCSQVFEHLFDIKQALVNLYSLIRPGGFLWLGFPASNRAHGSPDYYSAGYQPEVITNLIRSLNLELLVLDSGRVGSKRYYFMNHALSVWPTAQELDRPVLNYNFSRLPGPKYLDILRFVRDLPSRIFASTIQNFVSEDIRWACESYLFLQRTIPVGQIQR